MNSTALILLVLLAVYVPIWAYVRFKPKAKDHGLETWGPALKINTKLGLRIIERVARHRKFWHVMGTVSQIVAFVLMVLMMIIMVNAVIHLPAAMTSKGLGIEYALALPGLNPLMPFWFTLLGFIIALVFHEMAHGIQSRANDIGVVYTGLLYLVVPLGAFVEPDEKDVEKASRRAKLDLYAAGITANFFIAVVSFVIVAASMLGGLSTDYHDNAGVYSNVDADGIPVGAMITYVDGQPFIYEEYTSPVETEKWAVGSIVTVTYDTREASGQTRDLVWGARIANVVSESPASVSGLAKDDVLCAFIDSSGTHYIYSAAAFKAYMNGTHPGDVVTVTFYDVSESAVNNVSVTLSGTDTGYLGIVTTTAGMSLITTDDVMGTALNPFYNRHGISEDITGMLAYIAHPFSGFTPIPEDLQWWFNEPFQGYWALMCILYWTFWLNILLGITNALPAVPFDGGFIFAGWLDSALERMGKKDREAREKQVDEICKNVSNVMLLLLILVVVVAVV